MSDLLDRVFGPDPNPAGALPTLPHQSGPRAAHAHDWSTGLRHDVPYWECLCCRLVRSSEPPVET